MISAVRVLNMLNMHINSFGKTFALNLFVYNHADWMLGSIVNSSSFPIVTFVWHSFLNSTHSLDVYNINISVDLHVCGQTNNSMLSKGPREHVAGAFPPFIREITGRWQFSPKGCFDTFFP